MSIKRKNLLPLVTDKVLEAVASDEDNCRINQDTGALGVAIDPPLDILRAKKVSLNDYDIATLDPKLEGDKVLLIDPFVLTKALQVAVAGYFWAVANGYDVSEPNMNPETDPKQLDLFEDT